MSLYVNDSSMYAALVEKALETLLQNFFLNSCDAMPVYALSS
jgi:hypothetical protein